MVLRTEEMDRPRKGPGVEIRRIFQTGLDGSHGDILVGTRLRDSRCCAFTWDAGS